MTIKSDQAASDADFLRMLAKDRDTDMGGNSSYSERLREIADGIERSAQDFATMSRALDVIWRYRLTVAYEIQTIDAHLGYLSMPKTLRRRLEDQRERLIQVLTTQSHQGFQQAYPQGYRSHVRALVFRGLDDTYTRHQFDVEQGINALPGMEQQ